jgi:hypothetical protein
VIVGHVTGHAHQGWIGSAANRQDAPAVDLWRMALDPVTEAREEIDRSGAAMTADQKLAVAQIYATLSVAQELTAVETATPRP